MECSWFTEVRGTHPQTGEQIDEWGCAVTWMPVLLIDNTQQQRQTGAAVESFRNETVKKLQDSVIFILRNLGLVNANFSIQFSECKPSGDGIDNINFLFSANPDQKLAPLSNIISGGEMSRFLLAIKSSISKKPNTFF